MRELLLLSSLLLVATHAFAADVAGVAPVADQLTLRCKVWRIDGAGVALLRPGLPPNTWDLAQLQANGHASVAAEPVLIARAAEPTEFALLTPLTMDGAVNTREGTTIRPEVRQLGLRLTSQWWLQDAATKRVTVQLVATRTSVEWSVAARIGGVVIPGCGQRQETRWLSLAAGETRVVPFSALNLIARNTPTPDPFGTDLLVLQVTPELRMADG